MEVDVLYEGSRIDNVCTVTRRSGSKVRKLPLRLNIRAHSPDGFNWGYSGSGPAQLALALCCEVVPLDMAQAVYQDFKFAHVARWAEDKWGMRYDVLADIVYDLVKQRALKDVPQIFGERQVLGNG